MAIRKEAEPTNDYIQLYAKRELLSGDKHEYPPFC